MDIESYKNVLFNPGRANLQKQLTQIFIQLALRSSRKDFALSTVDVEELIRAREDAQALLDHYFSMMQEHAEERRKNLQALQGIKFISLGSDCLSRTVPTVWGIKPWKKLGENSHPFDLAVHPLPAVISLIKNDFEDYLSPENLFFNKDRNVVMNKKLKIFFNHEAGSEYAENNFELLVETYRRRIANFQKDIAAHDTIAFILHLVNPQPQSLGNIERLWALLDHKWPRKTKALLVINTWPHGKSMKLDKTSLDGNERVRMLNLNDPSPGYVWHRPKDCFSPEGVAFERQIVRFIRKSLQDMAMVGTGTDLA